MKEIRHAITSQHEAIRFLIGDQVSDDGCMIPGDRLLLESGGDGELSLPPHIHPVQGGKLGMLSSADMRRSDVYLETKF